MSRAGSFQSTAVADSSAGFHTPSPETAERIQRVIERLIARNARRIERFLVLGRAAVLIAIAFDFAADVSAGDNAPARIQFRLALMVLTFLALTAIWIEVYRVNRVEWLLRISALFDAALLLAAYLAFATWPRPDFEGLLAMPEIGIVPMAMIAAGCRLYRSVAWIGLVAGWTSWTILVIYDMVRNPELLAYSPTDLVGISVLMVAATVLTLIIARGTTRMVHQSARAAIRADRARDRLRVYVSDEVARRALEESDDLSLDGEQRRVAVLFCDLRGFTEYANSVDPKHLLAELNSYFDAMVPAIQHNGGAVDKFIGDSIMAVFSVGRDESDPAARAVAAAFDMHHVLAEHNTGRAAAGLPPFRHGIGIHSGWVVAGNVGTEDRLQHTVIGDVVNVASRLEAATKDHDTWLLISERTWFDARQSEPELVADLAPFGQVELRGVEGAMRVFAPRQSRTARPTARGS